MATTPRKGLPFVWISWLTGVLDGKQQCLFAPWFKAHFVYDKRQDDFDLAAWTADHTQLVDARKREFEIEGQKVRLENENWLRVPGETAVLVGKPDIVAELGGQFTIADGKTGQQSGKDVWQAWLYLYMLPKAWHRPLRLTGEVFYKNGTRIPVHPEEFDSKRKAEAFGMIRLVGDRQEPPKTPSFAECRFCDIACCPDRQSETPDLTPTTQDF